MHADTKSRPTFNWFYFLTFLSLITHTWLLLTPPLCDGKKKESELTRFGLKCRYVTLRDWPILLRLTLLIYKMKMTASLLTSNRCCEDSINAEPVMSAQMSICPASSWSRGSPPKSPPVRLHPGLPRCLPAPSPAPAAGFSSVCFLSTLPAFS